MRLKLLKVGVWTAIAAGCCGVLVAQASQKFAVTDPARLELRNVNYQGRSAIRVTDADIRADDAERLALLRGMSLLDGTIEVIVSGDTAGQWTKIQIKVAGQTARLYVDGVEEPTPIVNDLKQPSSKGGSRYGWDRGQSPFSPS